MCHRGMVDYRFLQWVDNSPLLRFQIKLLHTPQGTGLILATNGVDVTLMQQ